MASLDYGIIGIGGYGAAHLAAVHSLETEGLVRLQAVTEAFPHRCREALEELVSRGVRVYDDYREMLRAEKRLDIVSIATPLHLHMPPCWFSTWTACSRRQRRADAFARSASKA